MQSDANPESGRRPSHQYYDSILKPQRKCLHPNDSPTSRAGQDAPPAERPNLRRELIREIPKVPSRQQARSLEGIGSSA